MMLKWDSFRDKLGSYAEKVKPFYESGGFEKIYSFLKEESKAGRRIAPRSEDTFRAFEETPLHEMKCVMLGLCPYHTEYQGTIVADGLLMGCSRTGRIQPSLKQFYEGVENEIKGGMCLEHLDTPDVSYLSRQGVLMYNAALTTEIGVPGAHQELWEPFTKFFFEEVIAPSMVPVIFLGKEASKFSRYLSPTQWGFELYHPAYAARSGQQWDTEGTFGKVNRILKDSGKEEISWLNIKYSEL